MKKISFLFLTIGIIWGCWAESPKREFRATWLASVSNIDWPKSTQTSEEQKAALIKIFDGMQAARMNAVWLQVRPMSDALYNSAYEPWSKFLTGTRGVDPGYDPLAFAIEEAHKRGMELHAWINPYRYESEKNMNGADDPIRKNHPEWLLEYSSSFILDPGNPEVIEYLVKVIKDIVIKYNVDGIVFDDYFYPYEGTKNEDAYSQSLYKPEGKNVGDWRRENCNKLIADIYAMIQETKPTVKFGIGPFGIWGGSSSVAASYGIEYLNTSGGTSAYSQLYCDGVAWLKAKTIDYISPQCYWPSFNTHVWGYKTLVPWWAKVAKTMDRHFYSSMRISTMPQNSPQRMKSVLRRLGMSENEYNGLSMVERSIAATAAKGTEECGFEVDMNRSTDLMGAPGHVFFNTTQFFSYGLDTYVAENKFTEPALTPVMSWKTPCDLPDITDISVSGNMLSWSADADETIRYAVYFVPSRVANNPQTYETSAYLKRVTWEKSIDVSSYTQLGYVYAITAIDSYGNESQPYIKTPSGVQSGIVDGLVVYGGSGAIYVSVPKDMDIYIYSFTGQLIRMVRVSGGNSEITVPAGMYIVNGTKVAVQ